MWVTWQVVTAASLLIGGGVLPAAHLEFVVPLCMVAMLVPAAPSPAGPGAAALAAAAAALAATTLPPGVRPAAGATVVGIVAGLVVEPRSAPVDGRGVRGVCVMSVWLAVIGAGVATFVLRISLVAVFARVAVPPTVEQVLRLAAPASVAAHHRDGDGGPRRRAAGAAAVLVPWVALAVAAAVAHQTRSVAITVAAGMAAFTLLTAVAP